MAELEIWGKWKIYLKTKAFYVIGIAGHAFYGVEQVLERGNLGRVVG